MSEKKQQVSRRQFLNYILTGVGGIIAAGMLVQILTMSIDAVLKASTLHEYTSVDLAVDHIKTEAQRVEWQVEQVDGCFEAKVDRAAWFFKDDNDDIIALSPICTHLG